METTAVITDPSMADLRAMLAPTQDAATTENTETAAVETRAKEPETASETVETKQEPAKEDEPLPENVQKKIAKEAERAARAQAAIDKAVSDRKAKEDEAAKLTKPGSEPAPNTEVKDAKPVKPTEDKFATWGEYQTALAKYETEHEAWLIAETERRTEAKFTQRQQEAKAKERWDEAVKTHGAEFPKLMDAARAIAPEGLQAAISALDNWSGVAVHLAKNEAQLKELAAEFQANPYKAIATLGRIEAGLKTAPKAAEPLPKPPVTEGGKSSASVGAFDFETASMGQLKSHLTKLGKR